MASAKNKVIAGDYMGESVYAWWPAGKDLHIGNMPVEKYNIEAYELVTEDKVKSGTSAILRGSLGAAVLGPIGILAGLSAKNKGVYTVAILWKDGKRSLIEIEDRLYKLLVKAMF